MRCRSSWGHPFLLSLALGVQAGCGKRADPMAPYVKTPQSPTGLEVSQIGSEIEIRITAPRTTTESRPLPVIELEWSQAPPIGDFGKVALPTFREEVAPGEIRTKRFPRPLSEARFSVRAYAGKARSNLAVPVLFKPAPVPETPTGLTATNTVTGVDLRWTNPPGAEPWPQPTPSSSPSPSPSPQPASAGTPLPPPTPSPSLPTPVPSGLPDEPTPSGIDPAFQPPSATPSPSPSPTPPLALPTGIRIFRTDGVPRLAREPLQASSWLDATARPGEKPCYSLRYATSFKPLVESAPGEAVCVDVKDIVPPEPPSRVLADIGATFVELSWIPSTSSDVAFYRIYRAIDAGALTPAIDTQGPVVRIHDPNMTRGPRTYEIVAVDTGGNESIPAPLLTLIVP